MAPKTMLVVDQSALTRAWLMRILLEKGYRVEGAASGPAVIDRLRADEPDVIVVADDLPGMTGLALVDVLRRDGVCSGVVLLTRSARDAVEREAMRVGVDDILQQPCSEESVANAVADAHLLARERHVRVARERHLDGEMRAAAAIQEALAPDPPRLRAGWRVETGFVPASEVGGDCFDLFTDARNQLYLVLADVSGKGVGAALLAGMAQVAIRGALLRGDEPAAALESANDVLFGSLRRAGRFLTAFAARVDQESGSLDYVDAGHGHALVLVADRGERTLPVGGHPLGLLPDTTYEQGHDTLAAGDRLAVYSDGLVEGEGDPDRCRDALITAIRCGTRPPALAAAAPDVDDRTLIVLERAA